MLGEAGASLARPVASSRRRIGSDYADGSRFVDDHRTSVFDLVVVIIVGILMVIAVITPFSVKSRGVKAAREKKGAGGGG